MQSRLMDNHFHVMARRGPAPLGHCLRRLLTGLAQKIAARHRLDLRVLRGPDRRHAVSAARRELLPFLLCSAPYPRKP
jgi:hypothetical protein